MFFSFDGVDGSGKSTQVALFAEWLRCEGYSVTVCRDPGSTSLGEAVRKILLDRSSLVIGPTSEMLLYMAARAQLVEEVISPALAAGRTVVSDRFLLSNVVYQGYAGGLDPAEIAATGLIATAGLLPDVSLVLDVSEEVALSRMQRPLDRIEDRGAEFRAALRNGYLVEARRSPERVVIVDASQSVDQVQAELQRIALRALAAKGAS